MKNCFLFAEMNEKMRFWFWKILVHNKHWDIYMQKQSWASLNSQPEQL